MCRANYSFSRLLTFSTLVQIDTANNQAMNANVRLRCHYRPGSDLFVTRTLGTWFSNLAAANR